MPSAVVSGSKRYARSASNDALLQLEGGLLPGKRQETAIEQRHTATAHLLPPAPGESKAAYFRRLGARLRRNLFSPATCFDRDGIYLYKRPVRSESGDKAAVLASGGSVFHHVVIYFKAGEQLTALEFGPANSMDITDNMMLETPAAPVVLHPAPQPEPGCLPMLHVAAPHHPLEAEHVQKALAYAESTPYHALRNNCICFADFAVRVLTGGAVKCAPLIFDLLVGQVPPVDSPLLALLALTTQLSWHDVCDGGRLLHAFLQQHPGVLLPPPASGQEPTGSLLLPEPAVPVCTAQQAVMPPAAALSGSLAAFLASNGLLASPQALPQQTQQQPAGSSSSSEDTCEVGVEAEAGAVPAVAGSTALPPPPRPSASSGSSLASTGSRKALRGGIKGLGLPARTSRAQR